MIVARMTDAELKSNKARLEKEIAAYDVEKEAKRRYRIAIEKMNLGQIMNSCKRGAEMDLRHMKDDLQMIKEEITDRAKNK